MKMFIMKNFIKSKALLLIVFSSLAGIGYSQSTPDEFPTSFPFIKDTIYVSPSAPDGGDGSFLKPYNSWDDMDYTKTINNTTITYYCQSNTAYLFNRGDTMDVAGTTFVEADSIFWGAYGSGPRPVFYGKGTSRHLYFRGDQQYVQGLDVMCLDTGTCITFGGDSSKFAWADSMELSHAWWGANPGGYGKIILSNLYIHRMRVDGLYAGNNDTIIVRNTKIHDVNRWYDWMQDIVTSGGDCIQGVENRYVEIDNCYLDHSDMLGKFALIQTGVDTVVVKNTTLIGCDSSSVVFLGSSAKGWSFENCKIIGGSKGLWNKGKLFVKNCVFSGQKSEAIQGANVTIYNSTFANIPAPRTLNGWSVRGWIVYNCSFYNVNQVYAANPAYVWASHNNYYRDNEEYTLKPRYYTQFDDCPYSYDPNFDLDMGGEYDFYLNENSELIDAGYDLTTLDTVIYTDSTTAGVDPGTYHFLYGKEVTKDMYGYDRPNGNGYDIGAYEYYDDYSIPNDNVIWADIEERAVADYDNSINLRVFPNPTCDNVYYESEELISNIRIFDCSGSLVGELSNVNNDGKINMSGFDGNVFFVQFVLENNAVVKRVLKY